ncbi:MAG TPA: Wzz/FepE/Etk N-terminal domain-containing protein [Caldimonas sp.]|nr:Wzz/FepE/Etk N-terminal domain-containing protein [Caldimonas sp.]HEX4235583.1 Wzz/FepE/Etk N-terminal domain-containing protein [Caldimonas sp.]
MLSADSTTPQAALQALYDTEDDDVPAVSLTELLTWLGERKKTIAGVTGAVALVSLVVALLLPPIYTARASFLAPVSQQQGGSAAALASLGALSGLGGIAGLSSKTPDDLYVALLKSDSVLRGLDSRFELRKHYDVDTFETLRKVFPSYVRVTSDKKSGVIAVEVDDKDPKFAADLANAHEAEVTQLLGRLAVSDAQLRRVFFEKRLQETKENLIKAELSLKVVQEKSGVIVLDKQAEALITGAALLRAQIAEREVQLRVLRTSATEQNPAVIRLSSELGGLRAELARMESAQGGAPGSAVDMPVGKIPEASIDYVRARRELKLQEALLEGMVRQYEIAKLDEAKEGPPLQRVDIAQLPDHKSKPSRTLIVLASTITALLAASAWVVLRRYLALQRARDPVAAAAWRGMLRAWRVRR